MAITDPQAVSFANQYVRTRADQMTRTYYRAKELLDVWDALGLSPKFPNNPAEIVVDGSPDDGRTPISGQRVQQLVETYLRAVVNDLDANGKLKLNILLAIQTNGTD